MTDLDARKAIIHATARHIVAYFRPEKAPDWRIEAEQHVTQCLEAFADYLGRSGPPMA